MEISHGLRVDKGWLPIGEWNATFLKGGAGSVAEYALGRDKLIDDGIIEVHSCGCIFMITAEGAYRYPRPAAE